MYSGWMSTLSWQAGTASGPFLVGTLIQASAIVAYPDYAPTNWQGTLMVIAVTILVWGLNVWGTRAMPVFQNIMLMVHVTGFLVRIYLKRSKTQASNMYTRSSSLSFGFYAPEPLPKLPSQTL